MIFPAFVKELGWPYLQVRSHFKTEHFCGWFCSLRAGVPVVYLRMLLEQISNAWRYKGSSWKEESVQNFDDDRDDDGEEEEKRTLMVVVVAASANMTALPIFWAPCQVWSVHSGWISPAVTCYLHRPITFVGSTEPTEWSRLKSPSALLALEAKGTTGRYKQTLQI